MPETGKPRSTTPFWPAVHAARYRPSRRVATLIDHTLTCQERDYPCPSWQDLKELLITLSAHCYCDLWQDWMLDGAIADNESEVSYHDRKQSITHISFVHDRRRHFVLLAAPWGCSTGDIAGVLGAVWSLCAVGEHPTPGSVGQSLLAHWLQLDAGRSWRPPRHILQQLWSESVGGRADTLQPGVWFDELIEEDANNAYLNHARSLPSGAGTIVTGREFDHWPAGIWKCRLTLSEVSLGPAPKRGRRDNSYPTRGSHTLWLWTPEVLCALSSGAQVEIERGIAWPRLSDALSGWVEVMSALRIQAREQGIDGQIKSVIVAGLGRFGSRDVCHYLTTEPTQDGARIYVQDRRMTNIYIESRKRSDGAVQPHWYQWIQSSMRAELYRRALPYANSGALVATNYDAIYQTAGLPADIGEETGQWKASILHEAMINKARWLTCREKIRSPGLPGASRIVIN